MTETAAAATARQLDARRNGRVDRAPSTIRRAGVLYQVKRPEVIALAGDIERHLQQAGIGVVRGAITTEELVMSQGLDLFITIGGDGTMLRAARCATTWQVPLLGINMGRLGFLTECGPADWREVLDAVVQGRYWLEERTTLTAEVGGMESAPLALNEVVMARASRPRAITVELTIDGRPVSEVVADAMVVATATGSTAYALAAGGPVLDPRIDGMVIVPVAAHLWTPGPLVVPSQCRITLINTRSVPALLSFDGQVDVPLEVGQPVTVRASEKSCLFARTRPADHWYDSLVAKLRRK